ncbi:hypothetical protein [Methylopila sp. M107]|uniref:hypothetical protein n=1 Tax=Methylopila sp. M107 TaxID=1101190 RepID=UPI0003A619E6|nr:hypothetical protein [Methylopila sp. M107]
MSELFRAAAFGLIASLMAATSAFAIEATAGEADADARQAVELVSAGVAARPVGDPNCPNVTLAPDGDSRRSDGARATLDALARDCANLGAETIVKVGLVGESTRKKKGDADQVDAPITIQIKDGEGHEVEVRKVNLKVEMPEGVQKVSFQHVEENVSLPPPSADGYAKWTIVVGLDPAAPGEADEDEIASTDEQAEEPVAKRSRYSRSGRYDRSARGYRSRSARVGAIRSARASRSGRQRIEIQPQSSPVVVSAKPQGAPAATITTTTAGANSGSAFAKAAASFTERRDRALQQQQASQAQQRQPAAATAARQPQRRAPQAAPQPAASRGATQPASGRSAQASPARPQTTQTN